jgi:hypothetical protein
VTAAATRNVIRYSRTSLLVGGDVDHRRRSLYG